MKRTLAVIPVVAVLAGGLWLLHRAASGPAAQPTQALPVPVCTDLHQVHILPPPGLPRVLNHGVDAQIACATCHTNREPRPDTRSGADLDRFHQGLTVAHGGLSCLSCHDRRDYDGLATADGRHHRFADAMQLCAQCHGTQHRDYLNGAHGGMRGHWDLTRGGRERNSCLSCHDPHAPAFPQLMPAPPPRDATSGHGDSHD